MASAAQIALDADYAQLYESRTLTDFVLIISDGVELPAHRGILAARSKVFLRMLSTENSKEVLTGRCEVIDVDGRTTDLLLRFLYGSLVGKDDLTLAEVDKLLVAADKYEVLSLTPAYATFLQQKLSKENAAGVLILADRRGITELKSATLNFIAKNRREFFAAGHLETLRAYKLDLMHEVLESVPNRGHKLLLRNPTYCNTACVSSSVCAYYKTTVYSD